MYRTSVKIGKRIAGGVLRLPVRVHRDEGGSISIITIFTVLILLMLYGMMVNVGREVDGKIRLQNSADATAYSGALILTRGMNGLAYTNHLLCEIFSLTAIMREARDRNSESYVPSVLEAWAQVAPVFSKSQAPSWRGHLWLRSPGFPSDRRSSGFGPLGPAITQKIPLEQEAVTTFSEWAAKYSEYTLPFFELILAEELIPKYQQSLFEAFPEIAQTAAGEAAMRNGRQFRVSGGEPNPVPYSEGGTVGALWRTYPVEPVGGGSEAGDPSLPVYDPMSAPVDVVLRAREQRNSLAHRYLNAWNNEVMAGFDYCARMCQFGNLWRGFTCGYLNQLLKEEYPDRNLPFVIRTEGDKVANSTVHLEEEFTFVGVAYCKKRSLLAPKVFFNPLEGDRVAYAQVRIFVPHRRLVWIHHHPSNRRTIGGLPGNRLQIDIPSTGAAAGEPYWGVGRQPGVADSWDLWNQHWTCQLVPATTPALVNILQTEPPVPGLTGIQLPDLGGLTTEDIKLFSPH